MAEHSTAPAGSDPPQEAESTHVEWRAIASAPRDGTDVLLWAAAWETPTF